MTAISSNNTTISAQELAPPLKVALAGLTMIQQSLLEFYFETREGKKQYIQVLGKDADAYITNFDESGSTEAWENLYAHNKKPTLVLSHRYETTNNYIYIPKPITPVALENAVISLNKLLTNKLPTQSSDFLQFSADPQHSNTVETPLPVPEKNIPTPLTKAIDKNEHIKQEPDKLPPFTEPKISSKKQDNFTELEIFDSLNLQEAKTKDTIPSFDEVIKTENTNTSTLENFSEEVEFKENSIPTIDNSEKAKSNNNMLLPDDDLEALLNFEETVKTEDKKITNTSILETLSEEIEFKEGSIPTINNSEKTKSNNNMLLPDDDDLEALLNFKETIKTEDTNTSVLGKLSEEVEFKKNSIPTIDSSVKAKSNNNMLLPDDDLEALLNFKETEATSVLENLSEEIEFKESSIPTIDNSEKAKSNNNIPPDDDLDALLNELTVEDAKQKEQNSMEEKLSGNKKQAIQSKTKEENRWEVLCGEYDDISYKINTAEDTRFKLTNTLFPYLKDTIDFSKRSNCWMEISYKYLSVTIDPENKRIYSNISLEDRNLIYLCQKDMDEDQIELEEIDEQGIAQVKQENINKKHFNYSFEAFLWTTSLITSHGRLPDDISPDKRISINNWLSLKEVEKFPHIMQIAAVFNQHTASLNEVATWMNLPKRYVYSFYNGVEALDMIEPDSEKPNKEDLITMMKEEKGGMLKKILFSKIM